MSDEPPAQLAEASQSTRILLLRHAETAAPERFHGAESDIGLGENGRRQAERVAAWIATQRPEAIYSSTMRRAIETAEPIGLAAGLRPRAVPDLHERRMGPLSGVLREKGWAAYRAAMDRWMTGDLEATHEGGESYVAIRSRVLPVLHGLAGTHPGGTIAVVAHGVVIRVALTSLLPDLGSERFDKIGIDFVAINDLRTDGRDWWSTALNAPAGP